MREGAPCERVYRAGGCTMREGTSCEGVYRTEGCIVKCIVWGVYCKGVSCGGVEEAVMRGGTGGSCGGGGGGHRRRSPAEHT